FASARFSPRPRGSKRVRKYTWEGTVEYLYNGAGRLETRQTGGRFLTEFQNSDQFNVVVSDEYELLVRPFTVGGVGGVAIPPGSDRSPETAGAYAFGQQRRASGTVSLNAGQFYDGHITALTYSSGRVAVLKRWSLEPSVTLNGVSLPGGDVTTTILRAR